MGAVYLVRVRSTGGRAALKLLASRLAADAVQLERFRREAMVMGALEHPHLVRCLDFAVTDGEAFLVTELLDGPSLGQLVRDEGPLSPARAARLGAQVASALHAAHVEGVVHRDVKPSNVVVVEGYDGGEVAKLIDFGVASLKESAVYARLTSTGQIVGTPNYMAPEQLTGDGVDVRTDVYGLGALLYGVLAGRSPYPGATLAEVAMPLLAGDRPPLRVLRPDVGPLAIVIERAMSIDPAERFASARELADALARFQLDGASQPPRHVEPATRDGRAGPALPEDRPNRESSKDTTKPAGRDVVPAPPSASPMNATGAPKGERPRSGVRTGFLALLGVLTAGVVVTVAMAIQSSDAPVTTTSAPPLGVTPVTPLGLSDNPQLDTGVALDADVWDSSSADDASVGAATDRRPAKRTDGTHTSRAVAGATEATRTATARPPVRVRARVAHYASASFMAEIRDRLNAQLAPFLRCHEDATSPAELPSNYRLTFQGGGKNLSSDPANDIVLTDCVAATFYSIGFRDVSITLTIEAAPRSEIVISFD
jgi:serine/threonine protein kinase